MATVPAVGPTVTDVLKATSCGSAGAPPGAYWSVTALDGEVTSNVMASAASRTMPIGPCGTCWKFSSGVSRLTVARSQRSTSTNCEPWRTTKPSWCQLSTMPWPPLTTPLMNDWFAAAPRVT